MYLSILFPWPGFLEARSSRCPSSHRYVLSVCDNCVLSHRCVILRFTLPSWKSLCWYFSEQKNQNPYNGPHSPMRSSHALPHWLHLLLPHFLHSGHPGFLTGLQMGLKWETIDGRSFWHWVEKEQVDLTPAASRKSTSAWVSDDIYHTVGVSVIKNLSLRAIPLGSID